MSAANEPAAHRVLVVEDSESNLYVLSTWLRRAGYEVSEARDGAQAQRLAEDRSFDLAIVDINLPDMSGYDVARSLKARLPKAPLPVLHISSTATGSADRSEGLRRGAEGFLVRPVDREELLATAESLLRAASAQRTAIALSQRLRKLNEATHALNSATDRQDILLKIAAHAAGLFEASALLLDARSGQSLHAASADAVRVTTLEAADVAALVARALVVRDVEVEGVRYRAAMLDDSTRVLLVESVGPQKLPEDDAVLSAYVRSATTALQNMQRYDLERSIALRLQQNLLPEATPRLADLDIVTRYEASEEHIEIGGDFYEAFALDSRRVVIAVGDVVGHSLAAAMIMAQLRTAIRCFALEGHAPDSILERLSRVLDTFHHDITATVVCGIYDARTGAFDFANAGHMLPLYRNGGVWEFAQIGGPLLGIGAETPRMQRVLLAPGDRLLLYTDGLIERRNEDLHLSMERLKATASAAVGSLSELCDRLLASGGGNLGDDVAILALERAR